MLNTVFYIADRLSVLHDHEQEDGSFVSLLLDSGDENKVQEAYSSLYNNPVSSFSVTIAIHGSLTEDILQKLTSFFFSTSYLKITGMPVVILTGDSVELLKNAAQEIIKYIVAQGFEDASLYLVMKSPFNDHSVYTLIRDVEELTQRYSRTLYEVTDSAPLFFYIATDEDISKTKKILVNIEKDFKEQKPELYKSLLANTTLKKENEELRYALELQKKEISIKERHIDSLKSGHAAKELQEYYNKEYELLPKWYKRTGHIIKVIMGKRTLASLFSNKVKKYK